MEDAKRLTDYYFLRYKRRSSAEIPPRPVINADIELSQRIYEFVKHYIETTEPPTIVNNTISEREA